MEMWAVEIAQSVVTKQSLGPELKVTESMCKNKIKVWHGGVV